MEKLLLFHSNKISKANENNPYSFIAIGFNVHDLAFLTYNKIDIYSSFYTFLLRSNRIFHIFIEIVD